MTLVSMSVNEGGIVANVAGQVEGQAAYDVNQVRNVANLASSTLSQFTTTEQQGQITDTTNLGGGFGDQARTRQRVGDAESLLEQSSLQQFAQSGGYGASASARGSIYARAKSAFAYARRQEFLDAAITAAGSGDNFAKWVVRKSDLRSELAPPGGEKLVAASHTGFPNGDQPFHMLVKIPHVAQHTDWNGNRYVLFNSAYSATARTSWWKQIGTLGVLAKLPLFVLNPAWWEDVEESMVATVYPFKWDVTTTQEAQLDLVRVENKLGGRLILDDTDKIRYSDVKTLLAAESEFIKVARSMQTSDLNRVMGELENEQKDFRKGTP